MLLHRQRLWDAVATAWCWGPQGGRRERGRGAVGRAWEREETAPQPAALGCIRDRMGLGPVHIRDGRTPCDAIGYPRERTVVLHKFVNAPVCGGW